MNPALVLFWIGLVGLCGSTGAMVWIETHWEATAVPKALWWFLTAAFFGGAALLMVAGVALTVQDALVDCVADQSALAGVCVPPDQAG